MSAAPPGTYPGNPSLPREVRDKILSTFRHTLNLYKEGKAEDCQIGCDFILKMDPRFAPARQLMEKAKNPASEVDVAALEAVVVEAPVRAERASSPETDRLLVRAAESFNTRDFDAAIASAEQVLQVLPGNHDATEILRKARERKNAQPQFEAARQRAIAALDTRREGEARAALEKMRSLDADHPAVALLERRLARPVAEPAAELGESTNPGLDPGTAGATPAPATPPPPPRFHEEPAGGLGDLSLESLSLDDDSSTAVPPPPDMGNSAGGPLSLLTFSESSGVSDLSTHDPVPGAPNLWSDAPAGGELGGLSLDMSAEETASTPAPAFGGPPPTTPSAPEPPSQQQEIASLLERGDVASRGGNRQQAIEIWSRIFLIDINNAEAVARIERARQEMAEGNKRIVEELKRGREAFEAGDFTAAREAFLQVLALDETDATARSYIDRIETELARPSSGLDLAKKTPQSDILSEEMADAAAIEEAPAAIEDERPAPVEKPRRAPLDRRFVAALGAAFLLAILVGGYMMLRGRRAPQTAPASADGAPSLEHATALFRDGKIPETVAELKRIPRENPDYARAQKLLASLTKRSAESPAGTGENGAPAEKAEAPVAGPPPEALRQRQEAEKALAEKRYIDALTAFNLAAPAFEKDPTFAQSLGAASEKVSELTPAVKLYNEGEYETAIPILWRLFQGDRENQDARSYLLRCYYNQGIGQLQNGLYGKAADTFKEVIAIDPSDADATRHQKFAQHYAKGDLDLMGRIYVRHVQQRP